MQAFMYMRMFENDNHYAHPLDFAPGKNISVQFKDSPDINELIE